MTINERTASLLERAKLHEWPNTYRSLVLAMARNAGLESGDLVHLSPHWYNLGRYERECNDWDTIQVPMDADPIIVEPRAARFIIPYTAPQEFNSYLEDPSKSDE